MDAGRTIWRVKWDRPRSGEQHHRLPLIHPPKKEDDPRRNQGRATFIEKSPSLPALALQSPGQLRPFSLRPAKARRDQSKLRPVSTRDKSPSLRCDSRLPDSVKSHHLLCFEQIKMKCKERTSSTSKSNHRACSDDQSIVQVLRPTGVDDELYVRLDSQPRGNLCLISKLKSHLGPRRRGSCRAEGPLGATGQLSIFKGNADSVVITGWDEPLISEAGIKVKSDEILILRLEPDTREPVQSMVGFFSSRLCHRRPSCHPFQGRRQPFRQAGDRAFDRR